MVPFAGARPCVFSCTSENEAREWAETLQLQIIKNNDALTNVSIIVILMCVSVCVFGKHSFIVVQFAGARPCVH